MNRLFFFLLPFFTYGLAFTKESTSLSSIYVPVTNITINDGLVTNTINKIVQDDEGFIWIATDKGLNRYDAQSFKVFSKDKSDPYSIPGKQIERVIQMPNNELWLSIFDVGLVILDLKTERFTYKSNSNSEKFKLPNNNFFSLARDKNGNAWLPLFGKGLYQWSNANKKYTPYSPDSKNSTESWFTSNKPYDVFVDSKNRLWVSTIDAKVFLYLIDSKVSKEFKFDKPIYDFTESLDGEVYAAGYEGIFKFNEGNQSFDTFIDQNVFAKPYGEHASVAVVLWDSKNNLWIATTRSIMLYKDGNLHNIYFYQNGKQIKSDMWTRDIFEDFEGGIWVGTSTKGIYKVSPSWNQFNTLISYSDETIDIDNDYSVAGKIFVKNRSENIIKEVTVSNGEITLKKKLTLKEDLPVLSAIQFDDKSVWLVQNKGIGVVNLKDNSVETVKTKAGVELDKVDFEMFSTEKRVYFSIYGEAKLGYIDRETKQAFFITSTKTKLQGTKLYSGQKIDNELWMTTNHGIEAYNEQTNDFRVIQANTKKWVISSLTYINEKKVLIIANGSIYLFHNKKGKLVAKHSILEGLFPKIELTKIALYDAPFIWIKTSNQGVIHLNLNNLKYNIFTKKDGLPTNEALGIYKLNKKVAIITNLGVSLIKQPITMIKNKPVLVIDSISHNEKNINHQSYTPINLNYNYGVLKFNVALLSFAEKRTQEFRYMLVGASNEWIDSTSNTFSFLNLKPGKYSFIVKGRKMLGQWSSPAEFSFTVKPPPWKTWWAYLLYILSLVSLFLWLLYLYKRKLRYEHEIQKQQARKELADAASKAKSEFLARVSHEVRTPLNGILGMSEMMIDSDLTAEQKLFAESIATSGEHLLEIINDILDLSKIEAGKLSLENKSFDIVQLTNEIATAFKSQLQNKPIKFSCVIDPKIEPARIGDALRLRQILFNLLSNAVKFTSAGEIHMELSALPDAKVHYILRDTGIGIAEDKIEDLFSPFTQADSSITRKYGGTGLGLAIVKQIVEMMGGDISIASEVNKGTEFRLSLRIALDQEK